MSKVRKRGEQIRQFILENVEENQRDVATLASQEFGISRQAVNKHIHHLVDQKALVIKGSTRSRIYQLHPQVEWMETYDLNSNLAEDIVWDSDIKPLVSDLPDNVRDIWLYGFTEMLNNAIDHSSGQAVIVQLQRTAIDTQIIINDDGEGIFKKIQRELQLHDERHAVLELAKGKLTTDPDRHTGQGIFFTSRMFDEFAILSGSIYFSHEFNKAEDWILERDGFKSGTTVFMKLNNNTSRTSKQVFDSFSSGDDYAFTKTVVPVRLAQYGNERLVSRSQAKRLLAGVDKFKVVVFDFAGVDAIGQAFSDEVFRVFKKQHPEMQVMSLNANRDVAQMIRRAESTDT
ncbi:ArsR family transcriptional regulator [filamentous cyanobacterium CCT1]|nr:ArsR family transcriptional regulator [filamentous cyanobacterium CCT1]PSN80358.1 ArsR family transcriptional regulator [filamentous cyanobacterium CCP4]